jgi:hypothetical protein
VDKAALVTCTEQMADLMHEREICFGARVMHDGESIVLVGGNFGGLPATVWVIDNENGDVGPVAIAQFVNFIHVTIALVGEAPKMNELIARFDVIGLIGTNEVQFDVTYAAELKRFVAGLDGRLDDLAHDLGVAACRRFRVGNDHINADVLERGTTPAGLKAANCMFLSALCAGRRMPAVIGRSPRFGSVAATVAVLALIVMGAASDWEASRRCHGSSLGKLRNAIRAAPIKPIPVRDRPRRWCVPSLSSQCSACTATIAPAPRGAARTRPCRSLVSRPRTEAGFFRHRVLPL